MYNVESRSVHLNRFILESPYPAIAYGLETVRTSLVSSSDLLLSEIAPVWPFVSRLSQTLHPNLYGILQHAGNFCEGSIYPFAIYNGISLVAPRFSEKIKLTISIGLPAAIITAIRKSEVYSFARAWR